MNMTWIEVTWMEKAWIWKARVYHEIEMNDMNMNWMKWKKLNNMKWPEHHIDMNILRRNENIQHEMTLKSHDNGIVMSRRG